MPILIFLVLVILVAQLGFWKTFSAVLGAVGVIVLLVFLCILLFVLTGAWLMGRRRL